MTPPTQGPTTMMLPDDDTCARLGLPAGTRLLTPKELARALACHVSLVYRAVFRGKLRAFKLGSSRYLVPEGEGLALLAPAPAPGKRPG